MKRALSSTSHSDSRPLPRTLLLGLTALVAWATAAIYTVAGNVEVRLYKQAITRKREWAHRIDTQFPSKVVVCGGSSCAFSIDGERMESLHALPTVNFGLHTGFGATFITKLALDACHSGDTLVMAFEPGMLTRKSETSTLAVQASYALGEPALLADPAAPDAWRPWVSELLALRPGSYHVCTLLGKVFRNQPLYRYRIEDVHPSGWQTTTVRLPVVGPPPHGPDLSAASRRLLLAVAERGVRHHFSAVYSVPWCYTPAGKLPRHRSEVARFLRLVSQIMPVLKDPSLGCQPDIRFFADTEWHLTPEASALRTDSLGQLLKEGVFWTAAELEARTFKSDALETSP